MKLLRAAVVLATVLPLLWSAQGPNLPEFSGFVSVSSAETQFALKWQSTEGGTIKSWLRLGESAGEFKLVDFDSKSEVLRVQDRWGQIHRLFLPDAKVGHSDLTDAEFNGLIRFMIANADISAAPVLAREKARDFFLRLAGRGRGLENVEVKFDLNGSTLHEQYRATWTESQARARKAGRLLLAPIFDDKAQLHEFPLKPYRAPEPMTRNLTEADWDEIALLDATSTLRRQLSNRKRKPNPPLTPQDKAPAPTPVP